MNKKILRIPAVKNTTGMSRSAIYEQIAKGKFPRQIQLGPRSVGFLQSEIEAWLDERIAASRPDRAAS